MALALRSAATLDPEIVLAQAVSEFEQALSEQQRSAFRLLRSQALQSVPQPEDVRRFTAELNLRFKGRSTVRCLGPRFTSVLQATQQYAALGDVIVGASQNILAAGIWSLVRVSLQLVVGLTSYLERISLFFMEVGRSSPRYQSLALLYPRSTSLRGSLCHYFTVVTKVCHHFVSFSQKSMFGQLASSLDESTLRSAQAELQKLSRCIMEEVDFLSTQTIESEARENSSFRNILSAARASEAHRRLLKRRLHLLDGCSKMDFETPCKQARKLGDSTIFVNNDTYGNWKSGNAPSMLVLTGKLGSGKSVTMANIVDDLHLLNDGSAVIYFFCRHDMPEGLTARAIIGCLFRQLLQLCIQDSAMDDLIEDFRTQTGLEYIAGILNKVFPHSRKIRCLIDGLDECPADEAQQALRWIKRLRVELDFWCCVSVRSTAHEGLVTERNLDEWAVVNMTDDNPDIVAYINTEIRDRIQTGQLKIGDPNLVIEIRDTLLRGANGMFLWVTLQIQSLSDEDSDKAIRSALQDLPHDLYATFERILARARRGRTEYQGTILRLILAAYRPLTVYELREAISVTPNDAEWHRDRLVNDIRMVISCCGSLVMVDEEELSVRLIHHSVLQFILCSDKQKRDPPPWHFAMEEAHVVMGEIAVTYLNYGIFETRVSTAVVPTIPASQLTNKIMEDALAPAGLAGRLALMLLKATSPAPTDQSDTDLGRAAAEIWSQHRRQREVEVFHFLPYASRYWLPHTSWIEPGSQAYKLWLGVLNNPKFDIVPWDHGQTPDDDMAVDEETGTVWQVSSTIAWSISHDHMALLSAELKGRRWVRSFGSVMPYLVACCNREHPPVFSSRVATKLLNFAVLFRSARITEWLLSMGANVDLFAHGHHILREAVDRRAYDVLELLLRCSEISGSRDLRDIFLRLACEAEDASLVRLILRLGQQRQQQQQVDLVPEAENCREWGPMTDVLNNLLWNPITIRLTFDLLRARFLPPIFSASNICQFIVTYKAMVNTSYFRDAIVAVEDHFTPGLASEADLMTSGTIYTNFDRRKLLSKTPKIRPSHTVSDSTSYISSPADEDMSNLIEVLEHIAELHGCYQQRKLRRTLRDATVHAFQRGDVLLGGQLLEQTHEWGSHHRKQCFAAALYARSPDRVRLASLILASNPLFTTSPLRCIQLREWALAEELLERGADPQELVRYVSSTPLLHLCADIGDLRGLKLLLRYTDFSIDAAPPEGTVFGEDTLLRTALKGQWSTFENLQQLLNAANYLLDLGANHTICRGESSVSCFDLLLRLSETAADYCINSLSACIDNQDALVGETLCVVQAFLERVLMDHIQSKDPRPEHLRSVLETYLTILENIQRLQDSPLTGASSDLTHRIIVAIKKHYLKIVEMVLSHSPRGDCADFIRDKPYAFGGVIRYLLASYGYDVSAVPCEDPISFDPRPLALQATCLGERCLEVVKAIFADDPQICGFYAVDDFEDILNMAESFRDYEILRTAYRSVSMKATIGTRILPDI
ncbi:hypothetical protein B0T16DRAFT_451810 [Cercophora newfieldiana]|uniref:NACHT domain-containing protein n=1 Tax=Cercophora newfieldiana TaxID=92897 RepID=A0AA39YPA8_9PEZI|nr:hypothetical protein B0T16DRAFT_451810 [Cercophora newfieldiana]